MLAYISLNSFNPKEITAVSIKEYRSTIKSYNGPLQLQANGKKIVATTDEINRWIETFIRTYTGKEDLRLSQSKITEYLLSLAPLLNTEPVNAKLQFKNNRAEEFVPSMSGYKLNMSLSAGLIASAILDNKTSVSLAFETVEPEITLEKVNNLGIITLLGRGESDYGKSSSARIHNIKLGMSRFNGVILKPGEEFSFNQILGEVDENSGYQAELVIKGGKLVREFGGGLCQVATTVFRGAIMSGLDITERKPHSFPVQHYNPQGFDATIYPGVVDLKFKNNTSAHVLIQTKLTGSKLSVEVYGSSGGNVISLDGPYQYAKQPSGAMKAYFIRKIHNGETLVDEERFDSNYKAPPPSPLERNPLE